MRLVLFTDRCRVFIDRSFFGAVLNVVHAFVGGSLQLRSVSMLAVCRRKAGADEQAQIQEFHAPILRSRTRIWNSTLVPRMRGEAA
jgi:hypothetical protein